MIRDLSLSAIIGELERENLLPAIVFRTARSQCDADITHVSRNQMMTLHRSLQQKLKSKVFEVIARYQMEEELVTNHPQYATLVTTGVGAHHAGQLLIWRLLLEELMQAGLLRVLIATGTVAAGVDFPARTVVITAHSRRGSEGFQTYTASEFQQMSGRAGRRGKDTVGFCMVCPSRFCDARAVIEIAKCPPEPLVSAYFPSPSTVLNLLRYRNSDDLVYTVERSLAAFVDRKSAENLRKEARALQGELDKHLDKTGLNAAGASAASTKADSQTAKRLRKKVRRIEKEASDLEQRQVTLLNTALSGLEKLGYLEGQNLSEKGVWASNICTNLVLELSEVIESGLLSNASPERLVAIVSSISGDRYRKYLQAKGKLFSDPEMEKLMDILNQVRSLGIPGVNQVGEVVEDAAHTALMWMHADSWLEFRGLIGLVGVQEGDVARLITQTAEHLNQITRLTHAFPELARKAEIAKLRILRPPLTEGLEAVAE